jgi:hypothetical protein
MTWLRDNVKVLVTVLLFAATALAGVRAELKREISLKADSAAVTRELDQIHRQLTDIDVKLDQLILRSGAQPQ